MGQARLVGPPLRATPTGCAIRWAERSVSAASPRTATRWVAPWITDGRSAACRKGHPRIIERHQPALAATQGEDTLWCVRAPAPSRETMVGMPCHHAFRTASRPPSVRRR